MLLMMWIQWLCGCKIKSFIFNSWASWSASLLYKGEMVYLGNILVSRNMLCIAVLEEPWVLVEKCTLDTKL